MKAARLFPFAFIADIHGLALLAPYMILFLTIMRIAQVSRRVGFDGPTLKAIVDDARSSHGRDFSAV